MRGMRRGRFQCGKNDMRRVRGGGRGVVGAVVRGNRRGVVRQVRRPPTKAGACHMRCVCRENQRVGEVKVLAAARRRRVRYMRRRASPAGTHYVRRVRREG